MHIGTPSSPPFPILILQQLCNRPCCHHPLKLAATPCHTHHGMHTRILNLSPLQPHRHSCHTHTHHWPPPCPSGSEGLGKATAAALAKRGLNIILVSRSQQQLDSAAAEIRSQHPGVEVRGSTKSWPLTPCILMVWLGIMHTPSLPLK